MAPPKYEMAPPKYEMARPEYEMARPEYETARPEYEMARPEYEKRARVELWQCSPPILIYVHRFSTYIVTLHIAT